MACVAVSRFGAPLGARRRGNRSQSRFLSEATAYRMCAPRASGSTSMFAKSLRGTTLVDAGGRSNEGVPSCAQHYRA